MVDFVDREWWLRLYQDDLGGYAQLECPTEREMVHAAWIWRSRLGGTWSSETGGLLHYRNREAGLTLIGQYAGAWGEWEGEA